MSRLTALFAALAIATAAVPAIAEPLHIEAVMSPKEQMQLNFKDGTNHFVLLVRREGKAEGTGVLAGTSVVEYGMHDIVPGVGGNPTGYLEMTAANGDIAYINWHIGAVFVPGPEGKPVLLDNGYWQIVGGTGGLKDLVGAGTLHLKAVSATDRRFILDGEVARKH
jgi:hypothetical protein